MVPKDSNQATTFQSIALAVAFAVGVFVGMQMQALNVERSAGVKVAVESKDPVCFLARMRNPQNGRQQTCWLAAEWSETLQRWHVSGAYVTKPIGRDVVTLHWIVREGLIAPSKYFALVDSRGFPLGNYEIMTDQGEIGQPAPIGQPPAGSKPSGSKGPPDA